MWALPGGFVDEYESLDAAAARELQEETSLTSDQFTMFQVGAFGDKGRDPRGWTVTIVYAALVPANIQGVKASDDAADAKWFGITSLQELAFDHKLVICSAFTKLAADESALKAGGDVREQLQRAAEGLQLS